MKELNEIRLGEGALMKVMQWWWGLPETPSVFEKLPFYEGMIVYKDEDNNEVKLVFDIFKLDGYNFEVYKDGERILAWRMDDLEVGDDGVKRFPNMWVNEQYRRFTVVAIRSSDETIFHKTAEVQTSCYFAVMSYITDLPKYVNYSEQRVREVKKGKGGKKSKNKVIYIRSKRYTLTVPDDLPKRGYNREVEAWAVRGHWRTTKTGKRVWVKPHVKGDKEKVDKKVYKL